MNTRLIAACAILLALGTPANAHRLDEYLQATTISVEQDHIQAQMRLTPGVAVFPGVFAKMDSDADGVLSDAEQRAYAQRALGDLSLTVDGNPVRLRLVSCKYATIGEMKEGRGDIQLDFKANVAPRNGSRTLVFENHHQSRIAVYLVNCLVPRDPDIQVTEQKRNYLQSRYELDYAQAGVHSVLPSGILRRGAWGLSGLTALLLLAPLAWLWRRSRIGTKLKARECV